MTKLKGHWVAKRVGIVEHYKDMTVYEIALFDVYCLLSNKQTYCCYRTLDQLQKILGWGRATIVKAKKGLLKIGFIETKGHTGVYIPKLVKYENSSGNELSDTNSSNGELSGKKTKKEIVQQVNCNSSAGELNSSAGELIIEDVVIDEKNKDILSELAKEVLSYLNERVFKKFRDTKDIKARLKEGKTVEECKQIIDTKLQDPYFIDNPKYYHPKTLFRKSHWDDYINQTSADFKPKGDNKYGKRGGDFELNDEARKCVEEANRLWKKSQAERTKQT